MDDDLGTWGTTILSSDEGKPLPWKTIAGHCRIDAGNVAVRGRQKSSVVFSDEFRRVFW